MNAKHLRKIKREEGGIGLFSREQQKNTTPFQYSMQIAVGTVFIASSIPAISRGESITDGDPPGARRPDRRRKARVSQQLSSR